jgi:hypothetical protein
MLTQLELPFASGFTDLHPVVDGFIILHASANNYPKLSSLETSVKACLTVCSLPSSLLVSKCIRHWPPVVYHLYVLSVGGRPMFSLSTISMCGVKNPLGARSASRLELYPNFPNKQKTLLSQGADSILSPAKCTGPIPVWSLRFIHGSF